MLFLQYPPCSTCQKAKKWLDDHGIAYTPRHIKEEKPTVEELRQWIARSGLPARKFFNTSGLVYRSLGLKDKLDTMTEEEQIAAGYRRHAGQAPAAGRGGLRPARLQARRLGKSASIIRIG